MFKIKDWLKFKDAKSLKLNRENIEEWKRLLNEVMVDKGGIENYSECLFDESWLEAYIGMTPYDAVMEEVSTWED